MLSRAHVWLSDLCRHWLLGKPATSASSALPPKPDSRKVPALEEPPHDLPIFRHASLPPVPGSSQRAELHRLQGWCLAFGWLSLPPLHQQLIPHAPNLSPSLAHPPASAGATRQLGRRFHSSMEPQGQCPTAQPGLPTPLTPLQTSCCSSRAFGFVLCACWLSSGPGVPMAHGRVSEVQPKVTCVEQFPRLLRWAISGQLYRVCVVRFC